jgi:hypothetical protein
MNDKDKEAFEEWVKYNVSIALRDRYGLALIHTWQAACEYKETENKKLREALEDFILESEHEPSCKYTEAFGFREDCKCMDRRYYNRDECITRASEALKEIKE